MTKTETIRLFTLIAAAYPRDKAFADASPTMIDMWAKMLNDVPLMVVEQALSAHIATSPFPPSIAEIREWAAGGPDEGSAVEAWGMVMHSIRVYGYYDATKAKEFMGDEIWKVLLMTFPSWEAICRSENIEADRAHFFKVWNGYKKQQKQRAILPQKVMVAILENSRDVKISGLLEE